jgi:hypothetical protein
MSAPDLAAVKERPILMSAPMVRAILAGEKTQTRRAVTLPKWIAKRGGDLNAPSTFSDPGFGDGEYLKITIDEGVPALATVHRVRCPYADTPGDRLWVKETHQYADWTEDGMPWLRYAADGATRFFDSGAIPESWGEKLTDIWADLSLGATTEDKAADRKWRPSIFMPRWASRITLEITDVRVQRLQDISETDAQAEGAVPSFYQTATPWRDGFGSLWESINGDDSWAANPWVWALSFRRVTS